MDQLRTGRKEITLQIHNILMGTCAACEARRELNVEHNKVFSLIDGYCNKVCPVGGYLQNLGSELNEATRLIRQADTMKMKRLAGQG